MKNKKSKNRCFVYVLNRGSIEDLVMGVSRDD